MNIREHIDKENLHHAYLIEGARDEVLPEIFSFCENINIKTSGNPDFYHISIDNFKIDEAFDLRAMSTDKSFSSGKKIYVICANSMSLDAQNVLLKMFEEPIYNTHFFLVVPDANSLLKTLVSRFYLIKDRGQTKIADAERFISMSLQRRIEFLKELLPKKDEEDEGEVNAESNSSKALKFLNALEFSLHQKIVPKRHFDISFFDHFFKVRKFLRIPGSSPKTLMESVALIVPNF